MSKKFFSFSASPQSTIPALAPLYIRENKLRIICSILFPMAQKPSGLAPQPEWPSHAMHAEQLFLVYLVDPRLETLVGTFMSTKKAFLAFVSLSVADLYLSVHAAQSLLLSQEDLGSS